MMLNVSTKASRSSETRMTGNSTSSESVLYTSSTYFTVISTWDPVTDQFIGILLATTFLVGLLGNIPAFLFFRRPRNSNLPNKLYMAIVSIDILTILTSIPTFLSLFNNRAPMLFADHGFCVIWTTLNNFLFRIAILLVTILSVTRSMAIMMAQRAKRIRKSTKGIALSVAGYVAVILIIDFTALAKGWLEGRYHPPISYCTSILTNSTPSWAKRTYGILIQVEIILPSVIVFFSFVASLSSLLRSSDLRSENERNLCRASVTILVFTALFLLCNVPIFVYQTAWLLESVPSLRTRINFSVLYGHYGGLMLQYFPYVLNAGLNPCLYVLRMSRYKKQLGSWFRDFSRHFSFRQASDTSV